MDYKTLIVKPEEGIAHISVNRPEALNAINAEMLDELHRAFTWANESDEVKIVILSGEGRAFVAGADIEHMKALTTVEARDFTVKGQRLLSFIEQLDKIVIGAVNGFALGGGCELAMACDIRIASEKAKFGLPEVNLGIIPGFGGTQRLPGLVGKGMAKYLIMTAEMITAEEALHIGLVERVVPMDKLMDEVTKVAKLIMSKGPIAVKMAKHAINNGLNMDILSGIAYEAEAAVSAYASEDRIEGMNAFLEKRDAEFKNR